MSRTVAAVCWWSKSSAVPRQLVSRPPAPLQHDALLSECAQKLRAPTLPGVTGTWAAPGRTGSMRSSRRPIAGIGVPAEAAADSRLAGGAFDDAITVVDATLGAFVVQHHLRLASHRVDQLIKLTFVSWVRIA